ncbi:hypothetical protein PIROE2DRAFT_7307 [Piromyces sp. E2]|nr:hypothetical protein PIROE2DRAFT_7307 [Piromyces sp. E2]|eukprot:OUM65640.1 hypothetical protein PIROE2DRAFT_7307 [Piromyces sp. E2]
MKVLSWNEARYYDIDETNHRALTEWGRYTFTFNENSDARWINKINKISNNTKTQSIINIPRLNDLKIKLNKNIL